MLLELALRLAAVRNPTTGLLARTRTLGIVALSMDGVGQHQRTVEPAARADSAIAPRLFHHQRPYQSARHHLQRPQQHLLRQLRM